MIRLNRACLAGVALGALALTHLAAQAGGDRSIRVDLGNSNFPTNGESWNGNSEVDFVATPAVTGTLPFGSEQG
jgi:hypothetical protein